MRVRSTSRGGAGEGWGVEGKGAVDWVEGLGLLF